MTFIKKFYKECIGFLHLFFLPERKKKIVFFAEHKGYFPLFEDTITYLKQKYNQPVCYITMDWSDPVFTKKSPQFHVFYFSLLLPLLLKIIDCKIFITTLDGFGNGMYPKSFFPVKYVYMFHTLMSIQNQSVKTPMKDTHSLFDGFDAVFCPGPYHEAELNYRKQTAGLSNQAIFPTGFPFLDRISKDFALYKQKKEQTNSIHILIAPSWTKKHVVFPYVHELIPILLDKKYFVTLRFHPETIKRSPESVLKYIKLSKLHDRFSFDLSSDQYQILLQSDLLITDWSGIAFEYALGTFRPVLFIDIPYYGFNDETALPLPRIEVVLREKMGKVLSCKQLHKANEIITTLFDKREQYGNRLFELKREVVYQHDSALCCAKKIQTMLRES